MGLYRFDEYELRTAGAEDLDLATRWTAADPDHAGKVDPLFWLEQSAAAESWLLHDKDGPIFFFKAARLGKAIEIHVQFPPPADHRGRITRALIRGMSWLEEMVRGFEEIRFDSQNPVLILFCEKHLGFKTEGNRLFKRL